MDNEEYASPKTQYSKISFNKRLRLIEMVEKKKYSIYKASKQLDISNSTAKLIIKNYREEGRIFQKKDEKAQARRKEEITTIKEEREDTIIKKENSEPLDPKHEPARQEFTKLLAQFTQINLEWLRLYCRPIAAGLQ